jgi:hypothetical protein
MNLYSEIPQRNRAYWALVAIVFLLLLVCYGTIFLPYFPYQGHFFAHDWSLGFPALLSGDYWFIQNGFFSVPWASPFKCGGYPYFANNAYFTVAQWLTFICEPVTAVRTTLIVFAALGFWGFYLLMQRIFYCSREAAFLAGALFMFNGFFNYRTIIGHFFHADMLIPVIALLCLKRKTPHFVQSVSLIGLCFAYMVHAGNLQILPAMIVAIAGLLFLEAALFSWRAKPWLLLALGGMLGIALSLNKLVAMTSLLHQFPRTYYTLPGIDGIFNLLWLIFRLVFFNVPEDTLKHVVNTQWLLDRHEWEFGISPIPLVIILTATIKLSLKSSREIQRPGNSALLAWSGFGLCLLLPALVNWYTPSWNAFLKTLPYFDTASNLVRWFLVYIPLTVALSSILFDRHLPSSQKRPYTRITLSVIAVAGIVGWNAHTDRRFYEAQSTYDIRPINEAWREAFDKQKPRPIKKIIVSKSPVGSGPNDGMLTRASPILCYEPTLGYSLEKFPLGTLHPGPVFERDGSINLKNPACYLYPDENRCKPGDHFSLASLEQAERFSNYQSFSFIKSRQQRVADTISALAGLSVFIFLLWANFRWITERTRALWKL